MARKFNGTSDKATIAPAILAGNKIASVSFWLWNDTNGSNERVALISGVPSSAVSGLIFEPRYTSAVVGLNMTSPSNHNWVNTFPQPSAAAWHHYLIVYDRNGPTHTAYVDGVLQTLTAGTQQSGVAGTNFTDNTWEVFSYSPLSWFWAGRMAELACWPGVTITAGEAAALAKGGLPHRVHPDGLKLYIPWLGADSPEPDFSGGRHSATLTGTSLAAHPPVTPGLLPNRGFQPMPV